MKISREKINIKRARKKMSIIGLAEAYGVSRARMNVIPITRSAPKMKRRSW